MLIALGAEIILSYRRKAGSVKLDVIGIALVCVIVIVGGVIAGVQQLAPNFSFNEGVFDFSLGENWVEHPLEPITISVDGENTLSLENDNGRIDVSPHDGKDIVIEPALLLSGNKRHQVDRLKEDVDFSVDKGGNTVAFKVDTHNRGFIFGIGDWRAVRLNVKVPANFSLDLESDNGEIGVQDVEGNVQADTDNGKVEVTNLGGDADLKTDNGLIKASQVNGGITAKTSNGVVHIDDVGGDVHAQTDNGKVSIQSPQLAGNWEAKTSLGEIEVAFPETSDATIEAETDVGEISSDFTLNQSSDDVVGGTSKGKIGNGTYSVRLKTDAGSIKIKKLTVRRS